MKIKGSSWFSGHTTTTIWDGTGWSMYFKHIWRYFIYNFTNSKLLLFHGIIEHILFFTFHILLGYPHFWNALYTNIRQMYNIIKQRSKHYYTATRLTGSWPIGCVMYRRNSIVGIAFKWRCLSYSWRMFYMQLNSIVSIYR